MATLERITEADIAAARQRMPHAFGRSRIDNLKLIGGWTLFAALVVYALVDFGFTPARIWHGLGKLGFVLGFMFPPHIYESWEAFIEPVYAIGETLAMAFLGTFLAAVAALPLSFLGAKTIMPSDFFRLGARRGFDFLRALEQLILALVFIRAFGLGPLAGIFAIAVSDTGSLAKLFSEAIENVDPKPIEGVRSSGANRLQVVRLAMIPQVFPVMMSNVLYYLESNTRSATILGIVGAGGIGFLLDERIRANIWPEVMTIVLMILVTVAGIDQLSRFIRMRVIGRRDAARS